MAHRILGIDLGAYSVKVVVANPGFRNAVVTELIERSVPPGDEIYEVRAARAVGDIVRSHKLDHDFPYAAASGDKLFVHILEFPFRSLRRAELESAVGAELENLLPIDLEDMVFWLREPAPCSARAPLPCRALSRQVQGPTMTTSPRWRHGRRHPGWYMVAWLRRSMVCGFWPVPWRSIEPARCSSLIGDHAAEPRGLVAAPASYARIAERITHFAGDKGKKAGVPMAFIDIGHERTDICVVQSHRAVYTRTIKRGGRQLTEAISRAWHLSYEEAEIAKHKDGFVGSAAEPPQTEDWQRVHDVVITEVGPLAQDIKRTLNSCRAKTGVSIGEIVLVGGGSRLRGLASFLAEKLRVPVMTLTASDAAAILGEKVIQRGVSADIACLAAGVAFEGATGRPHFDLRQGELAYKADLSFLRQKATSLAAVVLILIAFVAVNAYASLYKLRNAEDNLDTRLSLETIELFNKSLSAEEALARAVSGESGSDSPIPKMSAYDILLEISKALPDRKEVTINVTNLDIKPGKITLKADAASNAEIDKIEEALGKIECFKEVSRGSTSVGTNDVRNFSFSIKSELHVMSAAARDHEIG